MWTRQRFSPVTCALALVLLFALPGWATGYYVRPNGNDQANGRSAATAFQTLTRAAALFRGGDQLYIAPGVYRENTHWMECFTSDGSRSAIVGDESGQYTGAAPGLVVVDCASASDAGVHLTRAHDVSISGLTFRGAGQGMVIEQAQRITIARCTFDGLARGLAINRSGAVNVQSSLFLHCATGLSCNHAVEVRVAQVTVAGSTTAGMLATSCGAGQIRNSLFVDNVTNLVGDQLTADCWNSDYNVFDGAMGPWGAVTTPVRCPYEWFAITGQERHSAYVAPLFVGAEHGDCHIAPEVRWGGGLPGMSVGAALTPAVAEDRDGHVFRARQGHVSVGAYDYPDPVPAPGWSKLRVKLATHGIRQSAGIYRADGSLVRMLLADATGVADLWWDGLTDSGTPAPAGKLLVKSVAHDVRVRDIGPMSDNGSAVGNYNIDYPTNLLALPDGGFLESCSYDEAGYAIRRYSSTGFPLYASNQWDFGGIMASNGQEIYVLVTRAAKHGDITTTSLVLQRLALPATRVRMRNGNDECVAYSTEAQNVAAAGLAIVGDTAYIGIKGLNVVDAVDLTTGTRTAEYPLSNLSALGADAAGALWALSGTDLVSFTNAGAIDKRYSTGMAHPDYLAVGTDRFAVTDHQAGQIAVLNGHGQQVRMLGKGTGEREWPLVGTDTLRAGMSGVCGCAFLSDGKLALTMWECVRILWPDTGVIFKDLVSDFGDFGVIHPTHPEFVYTAHGCYHVDQQTGVWDWVSEEPKGWSVVSKDQHGKEVTNTVSYGYPMGAAILAGKPYLAYSSTDSLFLLDASDPLHPQQTLEIKGMPYSWSSYSLAHNGDLFLPGPNEHSLRVLHFHGMSADGKPQYDPVAKAQVVSMPHGKDPVTERDMTLHDFVAVDQLAGDTYHLAMTSYNSKLVPWFGAAARGIGKLRQDGMPLWFVPSSGSSYQALDSATDGKESLVMAVKIYGGQMDVFDADGLRLASGAWSWPSNYSCGWIDMGFGVRASTLPDGAVAAFVEDDGLGRVNRYRVEGTQQLQRLTSALNWKTAAVSTGAIPDPQRIPGAAVRQMQLIPRVPPLPVNGDWAAWEKAGVVPQMLVLPIPNFLRTMPEDVLANLSDGTALGAFAHDGQNLYAYFVVTDKDLKTSATEGDMFERDSLELWAEEEQFGLGLLQGDKPGFIKYRYYSVDGQPYAPSHVMPHDSVWTAALTNISANPLGQLLADRTGISLAGKNGYAIMVKIPLAEIKLTGGIAGRADKAVLNMTGKAGEVIRLGVDIDGNVALFGSQDFKMSWPPGLLYGDPTSLGAFVLGGEK